MNRINIKQILSIEGTPFKRAIFGEDGRPVIENGQVQLADCDTLDCLDMLIRMFPRDRMTLENITQATRLKNQIEDARKQGNKILVMEEGTHDWVIKMLKDDAIGPKIFTMTLLNVIAALDDFWEG